MINKHSSLPEVPLKKNQLITTDDIGEIFFCADHAMNEGNAREVIINFLEEEGIVICDIDGKNSRTIPSIKTPKGNQTEKLLTKETLTEYLIHYQAETKLTLSTLLNDEKY